MSLAAALRCFWRGDLRRADQLCAALEGPESWHLRGLIAHHEGDLPAAMVWLRRALAVREEPLWRANLGAVLLADREHAAAAEALQAAVRAAPHLRDAQSNLSAALLALDAPQAALEAATCAVALGPEAAAGHHNRGAALQELGRLSEARAAFLDALQREPDDPETRMNLGILSLLAGGLGQEEGWRDYEARLDPADLARRPPLWRGEPLHPQQDRLLLYAEQGLGDTLHFCRYAPLLARAGASLALEVQPRLRPLLRAADLGPGVSLLTPEEAAQQPFRFSLPLLSLPCVLGAQRTLQTAWRGPYLRATPTRLSMQLEEEKRKGKGKGKGLVVVAVSWQGRRGVEADRGRSFPLASLRALADLPGVRLVSVQQGEAEAQAAAAAAGWLRVLPGLDGEGEGGAFLDTAAVMAAADLVVTADTATAHLAGALGRPVWIALRAVPDWRWGMEGRRTPWYPSARLLRQPARGAWGPVFEEAAARLSGWLSRRGRFRVRLRC